MEWEKMLPEFSVEVRNKFNNDKLVFARIIPAKNASLAKQYYVKYLGIELSRSEYNITATKLRRK